MSCGSTRTISQYFYKYGIEVLQYSRGSTAVPAREDCSTPTGGLATWLRMFAIVPSCFCQTLMPSKIPANYVSLSSARFFFRKNDEF